MKVADGFEPGAVIGLWPDRAALPLQDRRRAEGV
jgi:hypothetical protein